MFKSWIMEVYLMDRKQIVNDEMDIEKLFKKQD